jgi:hypothetical protein
MLSAPRKQWGTRMHNPLLLLVPVILAATRSLAIAIQPPVDSRVRSIIPADLEFQFLLIIVFSLCGLLASLYVMIECPDLGVAIAELNQF